MFSSGGSGMLCGLLGKAVLIQVDRSVDVGVSPKVSKSILVQSYPFPFDRRKKKTTHKGWFQNAVVACPSKKPD